MYISATISSQWTAQESAYCSLIVAKYSAFIMNVNTYVDAFATVLNCHIVSFDFAIKSYVNCERNRIRWNRSVNCVQKALDRNFKHFAIDVYTSNDINFANVEQSGYIYMNCVHVFFIFYQVVYSSDKNKIHVIWCDWFHQRPPQIKICFFVIVNQEDSVAICKHFQCYNLIKFALEPVSLSVSMTTSTHHFECKYYKNHFQKILFSSTFDASNHIESHWILYTYKTLSDKLPLTYKPASIEFAPLKIFIRCVWHQWKWRFTLIYSGSCFSFVANKIK